MPAPLISPKLQLIIIIILTILSIWLYQTCSQSPVPQRIVVMSNISRIISKIDCQKSLRESDGFICEPDSVWNERKHIYQSQDKENMIRRPDTFYFLSNWEPNFHCSHAQRLGTMGDGGKWVCDVYRLKLRSDCLIYSAGSSGDFSFEIHMKNVVPNCEIHTFDRARYLCPTNICTFHQIMFDNGAELNGSRTWMSIIQELNHTNRLIDILKIDIDGGEYAFFPSLLNSPKNSLPRQILAEIHPTNVTLVHTFFENLRNKQYVIFSKENNLLAGPYFFEFAFLKLNPLFFVSPSNTSIEK